MSKDSKGRSK